jgi:CheY-like chemotaxis protein
MMSVAIDVTDAVQSRAEQERANEQLRRAHDERAALINQLETANRAKDEFLAILGHELRNPLAPIVSALELIKLQGNDPFSREHALIRRQVAHVVRLVDDLLDVARIARGRIELKRKPSEIGEVIARALEMVEPALEARTHRLTVDVPHPIPWQGDPIRLAQVLANLLTNAARYTPPGGNITLGAREASGEITLTVSDDGEGIDASMLSSIFEMFVQGHQEADRSEGGLGLGLTLVKHLVERHGGVVVADSPGLGNGSTFSVRLPSRAPGASEPPLPGPMLQDTKRVLVVDDNVEAAELMAELLQTLGHEVDVAHDGSEALRAFERFKPQVAVLDIGLPAMDGYELAERMQRLKAAHPCRLVALTGYGQDRDRKRSLAAGFSTHLVKPVSFADLAAAIVDSEGAH